jgi:hypothetical protein
MKHILLLTLSLVTLNAQFLLDPYRFAAADPLASLNADMVAYWKFDEILSCPTCVDSKDAQDLNLGSANTGSPTIITNAVQLISPGWIGRADDPALSTGNIDFTWFGWVNLVKKAADKYIIGKWTTGAANTKEYLLYFHLGPNRFKFAVSDCSSFGEAVANTLGSPSTSTWYFIVMWHDAANNEIGIQVNNGAADTVAWTTGGCDTTTGVGIGAFNETGAGASGSASIALDETGFIKRLLTSAEKTYLYNAGAAKTCCPFLP